MTITETTVITPEVLDKAYSYQEYSDLVDELLDKEKTTGENHSEEMLHYTKMNLYRMKRLDKYTELIPELESVLNNLERKLIWVVITEGWCGDAAQNLPVINKMAQVTPKIELRLLLRDEHLNIMDQYLTNEKSRSIPKLVCLDAESYDTLGTWGPRPDTAQQMAIDFKKDPDLSNKIAAEKLHKWYADDKSKEIQEEFLDLIRDWEKS